MYQMSCVIRRQADTPFNLPAARLIQSQSLASLNSSHGLFVPSHSQLQTPASGELLALCIPHAHKTTEPILPIYSTTT